MKLLSLVVALATVIQTVTSSFLLDSLATFFQTIVEKGFHEKTVTKQSLVKLFNIFDGNPKYNEKGVEYLLQSLNIGENQTITFEFFREVAYKIYGDMISDDPYQPQEIHLSLTNSSSEMKVIWVTMQNLENPFVEYQLTTSDMTWESSSHRIQSSKASNWTYSVPQKWWPVFTGVLYESDMMNLLPERSYSYRVGGYDSANATIRYSEVFNFISSPSGNDPSRETRVFALADHGTFELLGFETVHKMKQLINAASDTKGLKNHRPDFVFVAGDLSYAGLSTEVEFLDISKDDEVLSAKRELFFTYCFFPSFFVFFFSFFLFFRSFFLLSWVV
jgi:hypothetical protein